MTVIGAHGVGTFSDPYPVHLQPSLRDRVVVFSGTTKAAMHCLYPLSVQCFAWTPLAIDSGTLGAEIVKAHTRFTNFQNLNVYQDDRGGLHAVLAIGVNHGGTSPHWTVLVHAHPVDDDKTGGLPLHWSADTVLSGSFSKEVQGNYDGKYYEDSGRLYLLYVRNSVPAPALRNEIVLQRMLSPTQPAPEDPTVLLSPGDKYGPLDSEWYIDAANGSKLVEAPYIIRIGGKYALIYSTGAYEWSDYKAGVAWSDTLLPSQGGRYRKVLQPDPTGIWGQPGEEVHYLLQSQEQRWPNFTAAQVIGPGVASAVQDPGGIWWLYFAGYDAASPATRVPGPNTASLRRPYFVQLRDDVPRDRSVAEASDAELATWLQPVTR